MKPVKILVVDDEKEICEITKSFLERRNYSCLIAHSESQALELVKKEHPVLVLLDVRLGGVSGIEVLRKLKQLDAKLKVIMVSGLGDDQTMEEAKSQGADDFLTKPFTPDFLAQVLERKMEGKNG